MRVKSAAEDGETAGTERQNVRQITQEDLRWLVCPICRKALVLIQTSAGNPHHIACTACNGEFPIADGLPVLLAK